MPLVVLCGLVALHAVKGLGYPLVNYVADAGIIVLLLTLSDQILLTCFLFLVSVGRKINGFFRQMALLAKRLIESVNGVVTAGNNRAKDVYMSPLFLAVMLILAGLLSPSDGVDSPRYLPAYELLARALTSLAVGVGFFLVYMLLNRPDPGGVNPYKPAKNRSSKATESHPDSVQAVESE